MSFESEFRAILVNEPTITAYAPATRINWADAPQGSVAPYAVLYVVQHADGVHLTGTTGLFESRVQVDCYAETAKEAIDFGEAICAILHGYRSGGFSLIRRVGTRGPTRESGANEPVRLHRRSHDFISHWRD